MRRVVLVVLVLAFVLAGALVLRSAVSEDEEKLVVVHWSNSHPMREGLLPAMAAEFNDADHETASGQPIEIVVLSCDSSVQADDLVSRVQGAGEADEGCEDDDGDRAGDPTIVTPQSDDWLVDMNHRAGSEVVALDETKSIAETWLGIVTYRAMAECLGWPDEEIGYEEILALRGDPRGWERYGTCAETEWGREPRLAFTNPNTSTSGRNVLVSLYSIAANSAPGDLTLADVDRPDVVEYVEEFQGLVDHYMPGTIPLNTKIVQGTEYGHFFLMPEDNLVSLYKGNEKAIAPDGTEQAVPPVDDLVMIYPKEGSVLNANPAAVVDGPWVSADEREAASEWIDYLRAEEQQRTFMDAGFRPASGTNLSVDARRLAEWGLDANQPRETIEPGDLDPAVLERIIGSWGAVKNPAIVTFVVDTSSSMEGEKLEQVKDGLKRLLDAMAETDAAANNNQVGLLTFSDTVDIAVRPSPLRDSRFEIADAIDRMVADGSTALYDAVGYGIDLSDEADGDARATRSVVVLSDGEATSGGCFDDIASMLVRETEDPVARFCGMDEEDDQPVAENGDRVAVEDVVGDELRRDTDHSVQVFFLGFGDADIQIGRILAEATGAEYQGSTEEDLAAVIEELSGYF
jgi:Ca-activated chloride channel family protein